MNNGSNKANQTPYGSSVIPSLTPEQINRLGGPSMPRPVGPQLPGSPSQIPGSMGVAGAPMLRALSEAAAAPTASPIVQALEGLATAFADLVADRVIAKLAASVKAAPDVEDLNRVAPVGDDFALPQYQCVIQPEPDLIADEGASMHVALEQALREREHIKVTRFSPGPLAFNVAIEGSKLWHGPEGDGPVGYRTCTAYAQPYGRGYTSGAKPNEYIVICDGVQVYRSINNMRDYSTTRGYSSGLTFDEVLALVDGPLRSSSSEA